MRKAIRWRAEAVRQRQYDTRRRVLRAVSAARGGMSLSQAARRAQTTVATIQRYAPMLVERDPGGRLWVRPTDQLQRPMAVPTPFGTVTINVRSSASASRLARYWAAVKGALRGDDLVLRAFRGKSIRAEKVSYPLITSIHDLRRLYQAGELAFEDLYDTIR